MKKETITVGDRVKIIEPEFFVRVGYPLSFEDCVQEIEDKYSDNIYKLLVDIGLRSPKMEVELLGGIHMVSECCRRKDDTESKIARTIAYEYMRHKGFGGKERQIFTERKDNLKDQIYYVTEKRVVKTGTYFAPSSSQDYFGEYEYEPGGLFNMKTHMVLTLSTWYPYEIRPYEKHTRNRFPVNGYDEYIVQTNVEKVTE